MIVSRCSLLGEVADYLSQSSLTAINEKVQAATIRQQTNSAYRQSQVGKLTTIQSIISNITANTEQRAASASAASASLTSRVRHGFGLFRRWSLHDSKGLRRPDHERRALVARDLSSLHQHLNQMISSATPGQNPNQMASSDIHKAITKLTSLQTNVEAKLMEGTKHVVDGLVHARDSVESLRDNLSVYVRTAVSLLSLPCWTGSDFRLDCMTGARSSSGVFWLSRSQRMTAYKFGYAAIDDTAHLNNDPEHIQGHG